MSIESTKSMLYGREVGQALTEFVIVLPLFLILTFSCLGLSRLVYLRWLLEERSRLEAFSNAHRVDPTSILEQHAPFRGRAPSYMKSVTYSSRTSTFGDLNTLIDSDTIDSAGNDDPIPPAKLSSRHSGKRQDSRASRNNFWGAEAAGNRKAHSTMATASQQMDQVANSEIGALEQLNPYVGTNDVMRNFSTVYANFHGGYFPSPMDALNADKNVQAPLVKTDLNAGFLDVRNNFTLSGIFGPKKSYVGAFQGAMRNVYSNDSSLIDSEIDNSVFSSHATVDGIGTVLQSLPLHGLANSALTSNLYIVRGTWDIDRQDGNNWRSLGDAESTYQNNDEEGMLRRRTMGLWLFPSNPGALLEPMTDLFPSELQSIVNEVNGPISYVITEIKDLLSDNPLNKILRAIQKLPIIGSVFDFELPEWPAVRPQAYPGSVEMNGDNLTGSGRNFSNYVDEQRSFKDRDR